MSDQDFFFDEDEQPKKETSKGTPARKSSGSGRPASTVEAAAPAGAMSQSVSMTVTVLAAVVAVLLGIIIGIFIGRSTAAPVPGITGADTGATPAAPQLTPEQMQSGQLPEGHPTIGSGATSATSGTASEATPTK